MVAPVTPPGPLSSKTPGAGGGGGGRWGVAYKAQPLSRDRRTPAHDVLASKSIRTPGMTPGGSSSGRVALSPHGTSLTGQGLMRLKRQQNLPPTHVDVASGKPPPPRVLQSGKFGHGLRAWEGQFLGGLAACKAASQGKLRIQCAPSMGATPTMSPSTAPAIHSTVQIGGGGGGFCLSISPGKLSWGDVSPPLESF